MLYYNIESDKLEKVTRLFNQQIDPKVTEDFIEKEICADWHDAENHQEWIDTTECQNIVDWLASFYN